MPKNYTKRVSNGWIAPSTGTRAVVPHIAAPAPTPHFWRALATTHASADPPPHVRSSGPSACCVSRQYCSRGRSTHAEAGMPTTVSVVDAIYFKNHSRKAWPSLSRGISSRSNDGLPKATCPRSSRCSPCKNNFQPRARRAGPRRFLATPRRLFLAPSLADPRSAESPSGLWPTRNTARLRGGLQRPRIGPWSTWRRVCAMGG